MKQGKMQMKRKTLVLLLALTLALSLMPMMAFAENGTEELTSANGTEVDAEEILSLKAKITKAASENTSESEPKKAAGQKAPKICSHTLWHYEYEYEYENHEKYHIENCGDHHEVTGEEIIRVKRCDECGETLDEDTVEEISEKHRYEHGVCLVCDNPNTCPYHDNPDYHYYKYNYDEDDKITIIDRGDNHEATGWVGLEKHCSKCEDLLEDEVFEYITLDEKHSYNSGGVCKVCGHLNDETRLYGQSRYDTAVTVANRYKSISSTDFKNVIVASGENFPDALSGVYLAKVKNAPILLVNPSVEDYVVGYISKNIASGGKVYILGGTGVVSSAFENKIRAKGIEPKRLGGRDRYETNLEILKEAGVSNEDILVCTGDDYPDSLSASAVGKPILLVGSTLTDAQKSYIPSPSKGTVYLIGGVGVVSEKIETELKDLGYDPKRLWGSTRYETSTAVAEEFFPKAETVILAYALNFPDGLSGGPFAMLNGAPIILTDSSRTNTAAAYVKSAGATGNFTLGGPTLISDKVVETIMGR